MAIEVLKEIIEIENSAEDLKKQAQVEAKEIVRSAEEQAAGELDSAARKAHEMASGIIKKNEDEARGEADKILESAQKNCESIRAVPQDKVDKAVNLVIERIVKPYGDS